ncbi:hypothetical protein A2382_04865 [Candidatus Woesebacteria bacterium RIFOXYB1_FULL_38_16]|uniref:Glycosyltransferase RgtA/B/C/D-like domain-containing protein n=1 Tax=Candidatus Woesebacteria bacterium RIFOXYB1_FULL_38_16 TaxID=1802538 RepID=A0A1F8CUK0_9BACT|nr:MAG: hypothetical protein A2382_04865 [Candidatus Woesebacteria bacterium RIFOXYB1_FULL_38_16]
MKKTHLVFLFLLSFSIYFLTSNGNTPYDYFTRLGASFLKGQYWITQNPPWLSELVPGKNGMFFVIQPPLPAILAMPFIWLSQTIFHTPFPQQILSHLLGAGIVTLTYKLASSQTKAKYLPIWTAILTGFGSIIWYLASTGSVWYLSQVSACFFLLLAIYESLTQKRLIIVSLCIGAAYLSRLHTILSLPFFLYLLRDKFKSPRQLISFFFPMSLFALFNFYYNYLRFNTIFDKGYFLIPGIYDEPWFSRGMLNIAYIPDHLKSLFLSFPKFLNHPPFIQPSWYGLAIWITTPAFVFSLIPKIKQKKVLFSWISIALIFLVISLRGGTGWTQFGYRYAVDFYPFLIYLTILGVKKHGINKLAITLLLISVLVNLWGVLWINKFNWVSY